jgi:hypothetical protein
MAYNKLNVPDQKSDLYQKFYLTTPFGRSDLMDRLKNDPEQVVACKKRLSELEILLQHDENRCHASRDQRNFLVQVLSGY